MTQNSEYVITRRFSLDGQIIDYLMDFDDENGTVCSMSLGRAMRFESDFWADYHARLAAEKTPTWFQTDAEVAGGVPAKPICYGVARVDGDRVIPLFDAVDEAEIEAAAH